MQDIRFYRNWCKDKDLISFNVIAKESDLCIRAQKNLARKALKLVSKCRLILEKYIKRNPIFKSSLKPVFPEENTPFIVKEMAKAGREAGVGPMAAVAGAIAEFVSRDFA